MTKSFLTIDFSTITHVNIICKTAMPWLLIGLNMSKQVSKAAFSEKINARFWYLNNRFDKPETKPKP